MKNIFNIIYNLELSLINPKVRRSADELSTLLADDFIEFGSSGIIYNKPDTIERLVATTINVEYKISNYGLKILSDNIIQATFKADRIIDDKASSSLRTSMWRKSDIGEWQMFFHQGTITHD